MNQNVVENNQEVVDEVKKRGRPNTTGIQYNKDNLTAYHNEYYKLKRTLDIQCECGALVSAGCMTKHKKRQIHIRRMKMVD